MRKEIDLINPGQHPKAKEWDSMTVAEALKKLTYTKGTVPFFG